MTDPALLPLLCWSAQLPLMLATALVWMIHGARSAGIDPWLRQDHHRLWHWALGFALPAVMTVVLALGPSAAGRRAVAGLAGLWALALLVDLVREWRSLPGPCRFLSVLQTAIAGLGAWAGWNSSFP